MRLRFYNFLILLLVSIIVPSLAHAQLSELSKSRIQQASIQCQEMNNELTYKDYWKNSVRPENMQTVCLAEKYSEQVAAEGFLWIEVNSESLMQECKQETQKDRNMFFFVP